MSWPSVRSSKLRITFFLIFVLLMATYLLLSQRMPTSCEPRPAHVKTIHLATRWFFSVPAISDLQHSLQQCTEQRCQFVHALQCADAAVFHMWDLRPAFWFTGVSPAQRQQQTWVLYGQESEARTLWHAGALDGHFDLTMTYKSDSDLPIPYGRMSLRTDPLPRTAPHNWTALLLQRTRTAFIVTSHCGYTHSGRLQYVHQLAQHLDVDVFGKCGKPCPDGACNMATLAKSYKFYLSFENSRCQDYVTEKFWSVALANYLVPVVLGGVSRGDYSRVAPQDSFVYAPDFAPKQLAQYLRAVASNASAYAAFFKWTDSYRLDFSPDFTHWACRTCAYLHSNASRTPTPTPTPTRKVPVSQLWNAAKNCVPSVPDTSSILSTLKSYFRYTFGF